MNKDWILLTRETKRKFANSTWVPLRVSRSRANEHDVTDIGYVEEGLFCGCVALPPESYQIGDRLEWGDIGIGHSARPYAFEDGAYKAVDEYQWNEKETIGVELIFEQPLPVTGGNTWIINPDLYIALRLVKEGSAWVRPEEDFDEVIREHIDNTGRHELIEIKRAYLMDYLAARGLSLRLSYYMQRVENVGNFEESPYSELREVEEDRDGGRFELRTREIAQVFGGAWQVFRAWRTDIDDEADAPVLGPESNDNVGFETTRRDGNAYLGTRVEGEFWCNEWIHHSGLSVRVRGDTDPSLPDFIVDTDGARLPSRELNHEEVGRWLFFRPAVVRDLLGRRGFSLWWFSAETGAVVSTSGYQTHFGLNSSDYVTVYAQDVARLPTWEQRIWSAHNVVPEGKVSKELLQAQVQTKPAVSKAAEMKFANVASGLSDFFYVRFGAPLYSHEVDWNEALSSVSRFRGVDDASLLRLAKDLVRLFSDRLNIQSLRKISSHPEKNKLGSIKLLEGILSDIIAPSLARKIFGVIVGVYDLRTGDAHPTSSAISEAFELAGIDRKRSHLRQAEQLIDNYGRSIWAIGQALIE